MWRTLGHNKGNAIPRRAVFFDCETLPDKSHAGQRASVHRLRLGVAQLTRWRDGGSSQPQEVVFRSAAAFWDAIGQFSRPKEITWIFAHSLLFDLRAVDWCEWMESEALTIDKPRIPKNPASKSAANKGRRALAVIDSPPTILCLKHRASGAKLLCVDTLNYLKVPLSQIGEAVGLPKLPMPDFSADDETWLTYCRRDVDIIREAMQRLFAMWETRDLGNFGKTIAQGAINAYRHRWMKYKIFLHDQPEVQKLERAGYFGGRTELFQAGQVHQRVHQYDVSGFYASVMREHWFPVKLRRYDIRDDFMQLPPQIDLAKSIARVRIASPHLRMPKRTAQGTVYPVGCYHTVLCGPELKAAADAGAITHWQSFAEYETAPIFAAAIAELWKWRSEYKAAGAEVEARACKLLANAMFGKFGQRRIKWQDRPECIAPEAWRQWYEKTGPDDGGTLWRSIGWHCQQQTTEGEADGSFVAISAFVTAYGRRTMDLMRAAAGERHVLYQGVDSLIVTDAGRDGLRAAGYINGGQLGLLRHQHTAHSCELLGAGVYRIGSQEKHTGRKASAVAVAPGEWLQDHIDVTEDLFSPSRTDGMRQYSQVVRPKANYWKGTIDATGRIGPLVIKESEYEGAT